MSWKVCWKSGDLNEKFLDLNSFFENFQLKNEFSEVKFKYVREEIDIRVESLVNLVHEMGNKLREKVEETEKEALKSVNKKIRLKMIKIVKL